MDKREKAKKLYEEGFGSLAKIAKELGVSENTVKSWKGRSETDWLKPKKVAPTTKKVASKKKKQLAKVMIEEGYSLNETSRETNIPIGTLSYISAKDNLQATQLENLKAFAEEHRAGIIANKKKRLGIIDKITTILNEQAEDLDTVPKEFLNDVAKTEEITQKILELDRIERLERIEAMKKDKDTEDKLPEFFQKLDEQLEDVDD